MHFTTIHNKHMDETRIHLHLMPYKCIEIEQNKIHFEMGCWPFLCNVKIFGAVSSIIMCLCIVTGVCVCVWVCLACKQTNRLFYAVWLSCKNIFFFLYQSFGTSKAIDVSKVFEALILNSQNGCYVTVSLPLSLSTVYAHCHCHCHLR